MKGGEYIMKMDVNQRSTSPKASGSPKASVGGGGGVDNIKGVSLPQYGGEGVDTYKGQKDDASLPQHGGEGGGKDGKVVGGNDQSLLMSPQSVSPKYTGPGRNLSKSS